MDRRKLMLFLVAMVVAIGTALGARSLLTGRGSAPQVQAGIPLVPQGPKVLVAQRALPMGTIITADAIAFQAWPKDMVRDAYFVSGSVNMAKLVGTVVRYPITAGQPVTQGALVAPGDRGFLAAALGVGMRAITISVNDKTGVAGFIFPGDHVDLMLTTDIKPKSNNGPAGMSDDRDLFATETIMRNLRVLATDQNTETETVNGKSVVKRSGTVTLEVTPKIAEKIEVAQNAGGLSLSLRPLAESGSDLDHAIASGAIKPADAGKPGAAGLAATMPSHAPYRPMDGASSFSTGGDVSRFQRRSAPATGAGALKQAAGELGMHVGPPVRVIRGSAVSMDGMITPGSSNGGQ